MDQLIALLGFLQQINLNTQYILIAGMYTGTGKKQ
jgi:hypothetical protein